MTKFVVGDVVRLNSGGEKMTVSGPGLPPWEVYCEWQDVNGKKHGAPFKDAMLTKVEPEKA